MSKQFGPTITKQEYHKAMRMLDSIKNALEPFEIYYEEFDILLDYKIGIYMPDELRTVLHASYREMKESILKIDDQFDKMEIDSEDYRYEFGHAVKKMVLEVNAASPVELFSASTYRFLVD